MRGGQARMELVDDLGSASIAGSDRSLERLGAVLQLLEIRVTGKTAGWPTKASFRSRPESAISGRKGDTDLSTAKVQVGFALSADR